MSAFNGGVLLRTLVVYDSSYGNTEKVALAICSGMKEVGLSEVECKRADAVGDEDFRKSDVWVIGTPTHIGGPTGDAKKAVKIASKIGGAGKSGAVFDTRFASVSKGGSQKIQEMMEKAGVKIVVPAEWFVVEGTKGPLVQGEEARAVTFGRKVAGAIRQK